jgi:DNA-binding CsgD family transcriptional regulator
MRFENLHYRERKVLERRAEGRSTRETGAALAISAARVEAIERQALRKLISGEASTDSEGQG